MRRPNPRNIQAARATAIAMALLTGHAGAQPAADAVGPLPPTQAAEISTAERSSAATGAAETSAVEASPLGRPADAPRTDALRFRQPEQGEPQPAEAAAAIDPAAGWWRTAGALTVVVSLILAAAALMRRFAGRSGSLIHALGAGGRAPSGLLQILGRYPVGRGQTLVLLKLDRRVLLLCQTGASRGGGMQTLCEVTDPDEVASILLRTAEAEGRTLQARFREMIAGFDASHDTVEERMQPLPVRSPIAAQAAPGPHPTAVSGPDPVSQLASRLEAARRRGLEVSA